MEELFGEAVNHAREGEWKDNVQTDHRWAFA